MNRIGNLAAFALTVFATTSASTLSASPVHCDFTEAPVDPDGLGYSCELVQGYGPFLFGPQVHWEDVPEAEEFFDMLQFNLSPELGAIKGSVPRTATLVRYRIGDETIAPNDQLIEVLVVQDEGRWQLQVVERPAENLDDSRKIATFAFEANEAGGVGQTLPVTVLLTHGMAPTHDAADMWSKLTVQFRSGYGPFGPVTPAKFPKHSRMRLRSIGDLERQNMPRDGLLRVYFDPF